MKEVKITDLPGLGLFICLESDRIRFSMHMHDAGFRIATKDLSGLAKHVSNIEKQRRLRQSERRSLIIGFRCIIEEGQSITTSI